MQTTKSKAMLSETEQRIYETIKHLDSFTVKDAHRLNSDSNEGNVSQYLKRLTDKGYLVRYKKINAPTPCHMVYLKPTGYNTRLAIKQNKQFAEEDNSRIRRLKKARKKLAEGKAKAK